MPKSHIIDHTLLAALSAEAAQNPRLRKNHNFHTDHTDACHRLLNALAAGTYVQPHCHLDPHKEETIIVLSGRIGVLFFGHAGQIENVYILETGGDIVGVNIPVGQFHSVVALSTHCVFFESKAGPYVPLSTEERASWAPQEGEAAAAQYLQTMLASANSVITQ